MAAHPTRTESLADAAATIEMLSLPLAEMTITALSAGAGLSALQMRVLLAVDRSTHINLAALADALEVSRPSASRVVDRLVEADLLDRAVAPHDRREIRLTVTRRGRAAIGQLRRRRRNAISAVLTKMTPPERDALAIGITAFARAADTRRPP